MNVITPNKYRVKTKSLPRDIAKDITTSECMIFVFPENRKATQKRTLKDIRLEATAEAEKNGLTEKKLNEILL